MTQHNHEHDLHDHEHDHEAHQPGLSQQAPDEETFTFTVADHGLVMTIPRGLIYECGECQDYHVHLIEGAVTPDRIQALAQALMHLAEHTPGPSLEHHEH